MKALAISYVWWPGIYSEIEGLAKGCSGCQRVQHAPQVSQAKPKGAIAGNVRPLFIGQAVSVRNYRGKEKWIQGIVHARTGAVSYQVEIAPNVIWRRHIDELLVSENICDTQDLEPVTDIPGLANEYNAEDETAVDIQDLQETLEPNEKMGEVEQPVKRYPVRIRHQPSRLGLDN
jgi:hypothetical protein